MFIGYLWNLYFSWAYSHLEWTNITVGCNLLSKCCLEWRRKSECDRYKVVSVGVQQKRRVQRIRVCPNKGRPDEDVQHFVSVPFSYSMSLYTIGSLLFNINIVCILFYNCYLSFVLVDIQLHTNWNTGNCVRCWKWHKFITFTFSVSVPRNW